MPVFPTAHKILSIISYWKKNTYPIRKPSYLKIGNFSLLPFHQLRQSEGIKGCQNLCRITEKNQTQHRMLCLILDISALTSWGFPSPECVSFSTDCKVTVSSYLPNTFYQWDCSQHPGRVCLDVLVLIYSHVFAERYRPTIHQMETEQPHNLTWDLLPWKKMLLRNIQKP